MPVPLYSPRPEEPMRVAGFMSGSGTNLVKILEKQSDLEKEPTGSPFRVCVIFTDSPKSNASRIAEDFGIQVETGNILAFYQSRGHKTKKDLSLRPEFDKQVVDLLAPHRVDAVVLAGYMSVVTEPLLEAFAGRIVNVHPADLRVLESGRRKYTGDHAVRDAIVSGEPALRATTHIVRAEVDGGEILMVSAPLPVELPDGMRIDDLVRAENKEKLEEISGGHQERLKQAGDWVILPQTLEWLARGRYAVDGEGQVFLDGKPFTDPTVP